MKAMKPRIHIPGWFGLGAHLCLLLLFAACTRTQGNVPTPLPVDNPVEVTVLAAPEPAVETAPVVETRLSAGPLNVPPTVESVTVPPTVESVASLPVVRRPQQAAEEMFPLSRTKNILILGSDRRPNTPNWRTDVIMIVAMDLANGEAGVISVPRDVYIDVIPNHQPNRVNVIDYLGEKDEPDGGGPALLSSIIESKMGIRIDHYLRFDFEAFKDVVDALGGVEVTVDCAVSDYLPEEDIALRLQPGTHRLDGRQALAYVRSRRQGGDLDRVRRQQRMMWAVRDQIRRENLVSRVPALYAALSNSVQTDVSLVSAIRYVRFALALDEEDVHGLVLTPPDLLKAGWRGGMSVFIADWDQISIQVQRIFDRPPFTEANTLGATPSASRCP